MEATNPQVRERVHGSRTKHWANKLAVDQTEEGLSNTQLMLINHDLKPVEKARRVWGTWNFVAFWVADIIFNRTAMACVWYGVQSWIGGRCIYVMIRAIWKSWDRERISSNAFTDTTTADFVSFFLFWLISLPFLYVPVHKLRHLFTVKSYVVPVAGFAFMGWTIAKAGNTGAMIRQPAQAKGSEWSWAFVSGVMSSIANFATLIVNDPDFTRFAIKPRDALWSQLCTIPIGFAVTSLIGILVSSASATIYGAPMWDPLEVLERFIDEGNSGERFGVFVLGLAFALAQLGTNIAANSISAGTDMTALLPRYINIRRGSYVCAAVGLAMCPWKLLSSSNQFTTYLSAYSVFLSSIAGVMCSDYYAVRRGYLQVPDLFSARKGSPYYYTFGVHWRAYAAYIAGILINVVGFAGAIGATVPIGASYLYRVNFFGGFIISFSMYWALCHFFPIPATSKTWMEVGGDDLDEVRVAYDADSYSDKGADGHRPYDEEVAVQGKPQLNDKKLAGESI
ncbi:Valyl-tRNA synthetase [Verticillium dahliae VDG1]|nr:Valyl-tRNA synthetase [Verticillium dahliae VDG1]